MANNEEPELPKSTIKRHFMKTPFLYARKIYQYLQLIIKTTSAILLSIFQAVLVKPPHVHRSHPLPAQSSIKDIINVSKPENINKDSGRPAALVQVRGARGMLSRGISSGRSSWGHLY